MKAGTGVDNLLNSSSKEFINLINMMLVYDPNERISAREALRHPYFRDLKEAE